MFGLGELGGGLIFIIMCVIILQCIAWFFVPFFINTMNKNIQILVKIAKDIKSNTQ